MNPLAPARLHVVVVEPYYPAAGHYADWDQVVAALEEAGAGCTPVLAERGGRQRAARAVLPRVARAARGAARRAGWQRATRAFDRSARSLEAARREAPVLAEAAAAARGPDSAILVLSSFASTTRTRRALGVTPMVEFLFEPPAERVGRIAPPGPRQAFVATTARIANAVEVRIGVRPSVLAHKPLTRARTDGVGTHPADDVARALDIMRRVPSLLVLGVLHGKKDLDLVARTPTLVPDGWAVVVAGDPQVDGIRVYGRLTAEAARGPVHTVERRLSSGELELLTACSTVVLIPQRIGEASMSGVLLDAISARRAAVAPSDSSAGDVIEACRVGATFTDDSPEAVRSAIARAASTPWDGQPVELHAHGLLDPTQWGARAILELDSARSTAP